MAIEIVDLPIKSMVMFHSYINVYWRVPLVERKLILKRLIAEFVIGLQEAYHLLALKWSMIYNTQPT